MTAAIVLLPPAPDLERMWRDLEARSRAPFFLRWVWMRPWLAQVATAPRMVHATASGRTVGLAFVSSRTLVRRRVIRSRTLFLNETGHEDRDVITLEYNDFLLDETCEDEARAACLRALAADPDWDEIFVRNQPADVAPAWADALGTPRLTAETRAVAIDLAAARKAGGVVETLSRNTRQQVRRALRLFETHGPVRATRAASVAEALAWFEALGTLHQATWTARGKPGAWSFPYYLKMHRDMIAHELASGGVEVIRVSAGPEPVGYLYNFVQDGWVGFYISGLAQADDPRLKPGLVTHVLAAQMHADAGRMTYDLMAGDSRYKRSLGEPATAMHSAVYRRPRLAFRLEDWARAAKTFIRRG